MSNEKKEIAIGRRKTANARVRLKAGSGIITVNGKNAAEYFSGRETLLYKIKQAFMITSTEGKYDVFANIQGGGVSAQAEALRHGISRALLTEDSENRLSLKKNGLLTRDSRAVERKKYGKRGARRSFQFSKR